MICFQTLDHFASGNVTVTPRKKLVLPYTRNTFRLKIWKRSEKRSEQKPNSNDSKTQTPNSVIKLEEEKKAAHKVTSNRLNLYVYAVIKDKLEPPKGPVITPESIQEATKSLRQYTSLNQLETVRLDKLIQLLHTVHGKQQEFTAELVAILQREALLKHVISVKVIPI